MQTRTLAQVAVDGAKVLARIYSKSRSVTSLREAATALRYRLSTSFLGESLDAVPRDLRKARDNDEIIEKTEISIVPLPLPLSSLRYRHPRAYSPRFLRLFARLSLRPARVSASLSGRKPRVFGSYMKYEGESRCDAHCPVVPVGTRASNNGE